MKNVIKHLNKILIHKWWVFYYAYKLGVPWRGFTHDLSKFSWVEFGESIKYYQGNKSPIPVAKKDKGYSSAWQHHKGRNPHHYEYWIDWDEHGKEILIPIPYKYVLELVADYLGAFRSYNGYMNMAEELEWWTKKRETIPMHSITKSLINNIIIDIMNKGFFHYDYWKKWYEIELKNEYIRH
jgi:hypothetical protein